MRRSVARRAGHSLLEVVIGAGIATIAFAGLVAALLSGMRGSEGAYEATRAQAHAREVMEELAAVSFDELLAQDGAVVSFADGSVVEVTVVEVEPELRSIRVEAFESSNPESRFFLVTLRADR